MKTRLYAVDVYRFICIITICCFHPYEILFFNEVIPSEHYIFPFSIITHYMTHFSFSGHLIVLISFFILSFKNKVLNYKKYLLLLSSGVLLFYFLYLPIFTSTPSFEWDIYSYLISGFLLFLALEKSKPNPLIVLPLCLILYALPFHLLEIPSPLLQQIVTGQCPGELSLWPLLPSIFLIPISWSCGKITSSKLNPVPKNLNLLVHLLGLTFFAIIALFYFGKATTVSLAPCYLHQLPFWCALLLSTGATFILLTLSNKDINLAYKKWGGVFLSRLYWNKYFGLCYLLHLLMTTLTVPLESFMHKNYMLFFFVPFFVFFATEISCRIFIKCIKKLS